VRHEAANLSQIQQACALGLSLVPIQRNMRVWVENRPITTGKDELDSTGCRSQRRMWHVDPVIPNRKLTLQFFDRTFQKR
jgi:hypothetical protein